jgi:uncharacterized membrane protein
MTESKQKQVVITKQHAILLGVAGTIGQGLFDLFTIHYPAIIRDLFVGSFIGFSMFWTSVLTLKLSKKYSPIVSRLVPWAVVPLVVFFILAAIMLVILCVVVSRIQGKLCLPFSP